MHITSQLNEISILLQCFMIFGISAASISGAIRAVECKMDITGAILLAFITANAGGTIRDVILGSEVFWIRDQIFIWQTCIIGALTFILIYYKGHVLGNKKINSILLITDAMGIAAFSLAGVEKSLVFGQNNAVAVVMGVWTAVGGGGPLDTAVQRAGAASFYSCDQYRCDAAQAAGAAVPARPANGKHRYAGRRDRARSQQRAGPDPDVNRAAAAGGNTSETAGHIVHHRKQREAWRRHGQAGAFLCSGGCRPAGGGEAGHIAARGGKDHP